MDNEDWGFSSSSDSDSDDERPVSKLRTTTRFYQDFQNGEYGANWPSHLLTHESNIEHVEKLQVNDCENEKFGNVSGINDSRILSPGVLNKTPENIVLINEGGKYRPIRVISAHEILPPRKTPDVKQKLEETIEVPEEKYHPVRDIPLEIVDFIDPPNDPRLKTNDYCYCSDDCDYPLPRFWREVVIKSEHAKNLERNFQQNGSFKRSISYVRERAIQKSQRIEMVTKKRIDPRLERSLFTDPPRRTVSPARGHNQTQPITKSSIFDCTDDVSSDSSALSNDSFGSLPSIEDGPLKGHNSTAINGDGLEDLSESDDDCSFNSFKKRKIITRAVKQQKTNGKVPALKIDLKRRRVTLVNDKKNKRKSNLLREKPPFIDRNDILSALTDDTTSEDQENASENTNNKMANDNDGNRKTHITKINEKKKTKLIISPINSASFLNPSNDHNNSPDSTIPKTTVTCTEKEMLPISNLPLATISGTSTNTKSTNALHTQNTHSAKLPELCALSNISNTSSTSIGSIEQRLAEMISPQKYDAELSIQQASEKLTDILSKQDDLVETVDDTKLSDCNNSTETMEEQSPPFESIIESQSASTETKNELLSLTETACPSKADPSSPNRNENSQIGMAETFVSMPQSSTAEVKENSDEILCENKPESPAMLVNSIFGVPDIGANTEIYIANETINIEEYTKDLDVSSLDDIGKLVETEELHDHKGGSNERKNFKRARIIINDFSDYGNSVTFKSIMKKDIETSDDDYEDDVPCGMDELTLPNSNTDRNAVDKLKSNCNLCSYQAINGWKQLTKHYVRKHPGKEISIARLAKKYNPQELMVNPLNPMITSGSAGTMIQSLCYICDEVYNKCSSKWLMHFIEHTGEFEFRCNECHKEISQDLHKECNSTGNERINGPHDFVDNVLYGYVCALCNYIQLSKKNVAVHLENEHQHLITNEENIIEIILLKSSQSMDFLKDDKFEKSLVDAKRIYSMNQSNRFQSMEPIALSDDEEQEPLSIDLTITDDED